MDPQTKRTLLATVVCFAILFGWIKLQERWYPPAPVSTTTASAPDQASATTRPVASGPAARPAAEFAAASEPAQGRAPVTTQPAGPAFTVEDAALAESVVLGDDRPNDKETGFVNPYEFAVVVSPRGAGVESVRLARYRNDIAQSKRAPEPDPYDFLQPVVDPATGEVRLSFVTERVNIAEGDPKNATAVRLRDVIWTLDKTKDEKGETAILSTQIRRDGVDVVELRKSYRLEKGSHHLGIALEVRNLLEQPFKVSATERGPVGLKKEDLRYEYRRVVQAVVDDDGLISVGKSPTRDDVLKNGEKGLLALPTGENHPLWTALGNKYFACIVAPLPQPSSLDAKARPTQLKKVDGRVFRQDAWPDSEAPMDFTFEQSFAREEPLGPDQTWTIAVEAFCGPKSKALFDKLPEAVARDYQIASNPDHSGCTFEWLSRVMLWLLTKSYGLVGNYGIAIIILVFIVRTILHPVTKHGQVSMMRMQKGMAKLKPKMEAIQQQYKNDKQKLNEETMKLYREEGVNPASQMLGCLPMVLQMPVWVALWSTLNTNVDMRHQPFFWWMQDLAAPDALISLPAAWHFRIPLIGSNSMMGPIMAFNLLPIIMTVTMYWQQKWTQKLTKPETPPPPKLDAEGRPIPDPMAQQQKIMGFMTLFFGLLFYNFPSGLNLYILSSNLLGMAEQWRIRKHIKDKDARGDFEVRKKEAPRRAGFGFLERLQKMAEQARTGQSKRDEDRAGRKR